MNTRTLYIFFMLTFLVACVQKPDKTPTYDRQPSSGNLLSTSVKPSVASAPEISEGKTIVVSTGKGLDQHGKAIQKALYSVLKPYLGKTLPFALQIVDPGKATEPFSGTLNKNSLWQLISQNIRFGHSPNALKTLEKVKDSSRSVLYFTDNGGIPANLNELDPRALSAPKAWQEKGIALTVLTTGSCNVWTSKANAQCKSLGDVDNIESELRHFLEQ